MSTLSLWMLLALLSALLVFLGLLRMRQHYEMRRQQRHGVQQLICLKNLMTLLQRHRGSSYGALKGDIELGRALPRLEQQISTEIGLLEHLQPSPAVQEHWQAFIDHWQRLQQNNLQLEAEQNLTQHNQLIAVVLNLLEDVAETSELLRLNPAEGGRLWHDLPRTAELIGQARVLGSGILASGSYDSVHKIRMRFVLTRLQDFLHQHPGRYPQLQTLTEVIDAQIVQNSATPMPAKAYFDLSTEAMEPVLRTMDEELRQLQHYTTSR